MTDRPTTDRPATIRPATIRPATNRPATIRPATAADLPVLRDVERAAGEVFREIGMPEIADDEPLPLDVLATFVDAGRAWVAVDDGPPVAYLIADVVDGGLHVEQVSVHPHAARRGIGRALLDHAAGYARDHGLAALTLTTFADVPWNAPYYRRCGFRVVARADPPSGPTSRPIPEPTHEPAHEPAHEPTSRPTPEPTHEPTSRPVSEPAPGPTPGPTSQPAPGSEPALTPGLRAVLRHEADLGLTRWPRVVMRRET